MKAAIIGFSWYLFWLGIGFYCGVSWLGIGFSDFGIRWGQLHQYKLHLVFVGLGFSGWFWFVFGIGDSVVANHFFLSAMNCHWRYEHFRCWLVQLVTTVVSVVVGSSPFPIEFWRTQGRVVDFSFLGVACCHWPHLKCSESLVIGPLLRLKLIRVLDGVITAARIRGLFVRPCWWQQPHTAIFRLACYPRFNSYLSCGLLIVHVVKLGFVLGSLVLVGAGVLGVFGILQAPFSASPSFIIFVYLLRRRVIMWWCMW